MQNRNNAKEISVAGINTSLVIAKNNSTKNITPTTRVIINSSMFAYLNLILKINSLIIFLHEP